MSVVPERVHEFYEPPKPQVGTALPRYGTEDGYLVLQDFKTRDLPRPPPPGWESAKRMGVVAVAALVIFGAVLVFAMLNRGTLSADTSKATNPELIRNDTNKTAGAPKFHVDTKTEDDATVQEDGAEWTGVSLQDYGLRQATPKQRRPSVATIVFGRIVNTTSLRSRLNGKLEKVDDKDATVSFVADVSRDVEVLSLVTKKPALD